MKVREFIRRLEELAAVAEENVDVAVRVVGVEDEYETALAELQWVIREPLSERWRSRAENNTHQIIVVQ